MKLLTLTETPLNNACYRYRIEAFRPYLEKAGHTLTVREFPHHARTWLQLAKTLPQFDAIILQRKCLQAWQLFLIVQYAKKLLFDIDDAVFLRDSYAKKGFFCPRRQRRFTNIVNKAHHIIAGNEFLANYARSLTSQEKIIEIPTCVDPSDYQLLAKPQHERPIELVWVGSSSTLQGLERIKPLLNQLGQAVKGIHLKLVCDRFISLDALPIIPCPWTEAGEKEAISLADIGISWIPNDPWSQGKCGLKILQYMAAGLPVVTNAVGVHAQMVRHGETGFLVHTPQEWIDAIKTLADDHALRERLGKAGRLYLEQEYSVQKGAEKWLQLLNDTSSRTDTNYQ